MKKEELIKENAKLGQTNKEWAEADEQRRKNLSEMLNAPLKGGGYDYSDRRVIYSWPEIYFALGKLIAKRDYVELRDTINRHDIDIGSLLNWKDREDELGKLKK